MLAPTWYIVATIYKLGVMLLPSWLHLFPPSPFPGQKFRSLQQLPITVGAGKRLFRVAVS